MRLAMQPSNRSLGGSLGTGRDWRRRLLLHHGPLALGSVVVLALFMGVSTFDANRSGVVDLFSGSFPKEFAEGQDPTQHRARSEPTGPSGPAPQQQGEDHEGRFAGGPSGPADPSGAGPQQHGGGQAPSQPGEEQSGTAERDAGRAEPTLLGLNTRQFTFASGYVALALLGLTLLVGPANLLLRRRRPVSSYLARDIGTWAATFSVVHVIYGAEVHASITDPIPMFIQDGSPLTNSFGLANWTGLAATAIVVGLLVISSNFALRKLKARTWKNLQRLNYALFALVIVHAFFYGALLRTESPYTLMLAASVVTVFIGQSAGIWLWRRRYGRRGETLAQQSG